MQDAFAVRSSESKQKQLSRAGKFKEEIVPVEIPR
ncbi:MAG: hypothetical protein ACLTDC_15900 [Lachnospiraceae bacterium]